MSLSHSQPAISSTSRLSSIEPTMFQRLSKPPMSSTSKFNPLTTCHAFDILISNESTDPTMSPSHPQPALSSSTF
eukprot:scaffold20335_cov35-Attheya_sp.AAC.1